MFLLSWQTKGPGWEEALLGSEKDGVRFTLTQQPTCYRRGPHRLLIEVCGGSHHHDWGCFDTADQPERYYHNIDAVYREAESIAKILWIDRLKVGPLEA